jgi:hypothetical protein
MTNSFRPWSFVLRGQTKTPTFSRAAKEAGVQHLYPVQTVISLRCYQCSKKIIPQPVLPCQTHRDEKAIQLANYTVYFCTILVQEE